MKGRYYLFAAEGGTEYGHAEVVGRSASPFGPFEPFAAQPDPDAPRPARARRSRRPATPISSSSTTARPGRCSSASRPQERPLPPPRARDVPGARCASRADGWPTIGDARPRRAAHAGAARCRRNRPRPSRRATTSIGAALALAWNFVRNPNAGDVSLTARPGFLRLTGSAVTLDDVASPALVVRRQQHFRVRCRAALDFAPREAERGGGAHRARQRKLPLRPGRAAGGAGREAVLTSRIAGASTVVGRAPLPDGAVTLEVVRRRDVVHVRASRRGDAAVAEAGHVAGAHAVGRGDRQHGTPPLHRRVHRPVRDRPRQARDRRPPTSTGSTTRPSRRCGARASCCSRSRC